MIETDHLFLNRINLIQSNAMNRTNSNTISFLNTDQNVPASDIVKVISKRTNAPVNIIGIPTLAVLRGFLLCTGLRDDFYDSGVSSFLTLLSFSITSEMMIISTPATCMTRAEPLPTPIPSVSPRKSESRPDTA